MKTLAEPEYWTDMWTRRELQYDPNSVTFKDVFDRHLPKGGDCFEVGCYPGGYLIYLANRFGYRVHGIDMYPGATSELPSHLARHGAKVGTILQGDFFTFPPPMQYDVVCSFGFVEHFPDVTAVFKRHAELVKPGALLVITCPNFRRLQFLLKRMLDRDTLAKHVLETMDFRVWNQAIQAAGLVTLEQGYYRTFDFWVEPADRSRIAEWTAKKIRSFGHLVDRNVNYPNRFSSPFMYTVCRKSA